jgi:hypothetical protein
LLVSVKRARRPAHEATPGGRLLAHAIADEIGRAVDYRPVETDAAARQLHPV